MARAATAKKSNIYTWEGKNKKGQNIKGEMSAVSIDLVKADLRRQGIVPKAGKVKKKSKPLFGGEKKITSRDIAVFSRQLATMLKAGVPLVQSFDIVGTGHANPSMQKLLMAIKYDIEGGSTLASALSKHHYYFDDLFCNLVDAGEQSGALETLLEKIATYKEKTEALKAKIKKALTYPMSVMVIAFIVTAILLIFVVPTFADMFKGFGADLPAFTLFVVHLSDFFINWWWAVFGSIIGAVVAFTQAKKRSRAFNERLDRIALKLPAIGSLTFNSAIARFARTLSTMFAAGVPLVEAMVSVAGATGSSVYRDAVLKLRDDVASGQQLQSSLSASPDLWPNMLVQMVGIGEESGALDEMLSKVAEYYEAEVDDAVDNLTALMEPVIMCFLAVVIGGLVIAMYLPVFKMGEVVGGA